MGTNSGAHELNHEGASTRDLITRTRTSASLKTFQMSQSFD